MQERWRMNKLGFVNFWLYDWEEFPFSEGRLLLRGENGAGKSVTTQSFIPFMLDGDLRPYRLDSFGSKDRKMSYYLLGEDKEESTGYLYLEFIKPEHRLYRTLVVGLSLIHIWHETGPGIYRGQVPYHHGGKSLSTVSDDHWRLSAGGGSFTAGALVSP